MKLFVLDTSALIRFYVPDGPISEELDEIIESTWRSTVAVLIPELCLAEFVQVLWKKEKAGFLKVDEVDEILISFLDLPLEVIAHQEYLVEALAMSRVHGITVYDSLFLSLAVKKKGSAYNSR